MVSLKNIFKNLKKKSLYKSNSEKMKPTYCFILNGPIDRLFFFTRSKFLQIFSKLKTKYVFINLSIKGGNRELIHLISLKSRDVK